MAVHFNIDYVNNEGRISNYYPDFIVNRDNKNIYIVETKGREDVDDPLKMHRLAQWCKDINNAQDTHHFDYIFVGEYDFDTFKPGSFGALAENFRKYKDG
jgi:type III restriction enzyme